MEKYIPIVIIGAVALLLITWLVRILTHLEYLRRANIEISRTHGREKRFWKRAKRDCLWEIFTFIPKK